MEKFTVIFLDDDNKTVLETQTVDRGASVSYSGSQTEKTINNVKYTLVGWIGEEHMQDVQSDLRLIAKYQPIKDQSPEDALFEATKDSAKKTRLSQTVTAGNKVVDQERATEGLSRGALVETILKEGIVVIETPDKGKTAGDNGAQIDDEIR